MNLSMGTIIAKRYAILEKLGEGAFGATYLTRDIIEDRTVVVKVARSSDRDIVERVRAEAEALVTIHNPNIAAILDIGSLEDGRPFIITKRVEGMTLDQITQQQLSLINVLDVAFAITSGLAAAHERGIIHRDLKPSNVLIPVHNGSLLYSDAILLDFGALGKLKGSSNLTRSGEVFGTPKYMSPEQIRGQAQTPATDVYGVGMLLYEMICGKTPFSDDGSTDGLQLIQRLLTEPATFPPSLTIPHSVRELILHCLAKEPAHRYQSARQLHVEIDVLRQSIAHSPAIAGDDLPGPHSAVKPAPSALPAPPRSCRGNTLRIGCAVSAIVIAIVFTFVGSPDTLGIGVGLILIGLGLALGSAARAIIRKHKPELEWDADKLLAQARASGRIDQSLAAQVEELIAKCRSVDQRLLGLTMSGMVEEFHSAKESKSRQDALMNLVQILEKLMKSLSPWYVRQEKLIAFAVTTIGMVSGVVSIIAAIFKLIEPGR